jgi:5'-nucleotidase/UDP-sugar diphosphatase
MWNSSSRVRLALLTAAALAQGCLAYNDQCQPLVDNPTERVAFVAKGTEVWDDKPNARHANNAIGQQAADAFAWVFSGSTQPADFGVVNGGSIRAEGLCVTRNIIKEGPLTNGVLHEVMLFENSVRAITLSESEVVKMFEHSAERLFASPAPIVLPAGSFLQVSGGVHMEIDCARAVGSRLVSLSIGGAAVPLPGRSTIGYRVALSDYLFGGGDGYAMLPGPESTRATQPAPRFGGIDSNIVAAYLKQSPFNVAVEQGFVVDPARVVFTNCSVPGRPSN